MRNEQTQKLGLDLELEPQPSTNVQQRCRWVLATTMAATTVERSSRGGGGNGRKLSLILLLSLLAALSVARKVMPTTSSEGEGSTATTPTGTGNVRGSAVGTTVPASASTSAGMRPAMSPVSAASPRKNASSTSPSPPSPRRDVELTAASLPIYLHQSSTNLTARTTWGTVAARWNRTAEYDDLLRDAAPVRSLPAARSSARRTAIMIHCGPKTGSTTLRRACRKNLERTCEGVERGRNSFPEGYMDESKLYPLMRRCANTTHFCAKEVDLPASFDDVPLYDDVRFVHMFPFRNYDEWAASAMKQQHDRGGERACAKAEEKLQDCVPSHMEIDLRKYGKTELARFKRGVVPRMAEGEEHVFLLYHHRELNDVLARLSDAYGVPLLPGSDGKGKAKRPEGTCDPKLLRMYHECFSSQLMDIS